MSANTIHAPTKGVRVERFYSNNGSPIEIINKVNSFLAKFDGYHILPEHFQISYHQQGGCWWAFVTYPTYTEG